ncbi:hypothetical protein [Parendozoicomonas haliclonae]|uniref:UrcA family protein n=1 Tax=Parendozoicomonas haliclonae TaxID=1960125 RepID=A0A1X7AE43_9GAMM|nr:hypothetical protein [Parendozoicomonas haliclonae]SMA33403.1 hypothetical protein EHSB41UT_00273 [Parendozoicomonas haliclonae]
MIRYFLGLAIFFAVLVNAEPETVAEDTLSYRNTLTSLTIDHAGERPECIRDAARILTAIAPREDNCGAVVERILASI